MAMAGLGVLTCPRTRLLIPPSAAPSVGFGLRRNPAAKAVPPNSSRVLLPQMKFPEVPFVGAFGLRSCAHL